MPKRMIVGEIWEDNFFTSLTDFQGLLWIGLITGCADDQGRLQDNPILIRSKIFPVRDVPVLDIEVSLDTFAKAKKVIRYIKNNQKAIQIVNWWKYQIPSWAGKSSLIAPDNWTDRTRYHGKSDPTTGKLPIIESNWNLPGGFVEGYLDLYVDGYLDAKVKVYPGVILHNEVEDEVEDKVKIEVKVESEKSGVENIELNNHKKNGFHPEDNPGLIRSYDQGRDGIPGTIFKDDYPVKR